MNFEEITPHTDDGEKALLSIAMQWPESIDQIEAANSRCGLFFKPSHRDIFSRLLAMKSSGEEIGLTSLTIKLEQSGILELVGGRMEIADIYDSTHSIALLGQYLKICQQYGTRRSLLQTLSQAIRDAYDGTSEIEQVIETLDNEVRRMLEGSNQAQLIDMKQSLRETVELVQQRMQADGQIPGISTGIESLDEMTNGFQSGQLWVIGARPGVGKTALGLQFAKTVAGVEPVLFASAEMEHTELSGRAISSESGIEGLKLLRGDVTKSDFPKIQRSLEKLSTLPIYIIDKAGMGLSDVKIAARTSTRDHGVKVIIVDYLQLLEEESNSRNREDAVRRLSNGLKNLAKELGVVVIALAQLNRAAAKRGKSESPNLSDLRDSGSIEQDANVVLLLHRKTPMDENPDIIDIQMIVAKCRGGRVGAIEMEYNSPTTSFSEKEYYVPN